MNELLISELKAVLSLDNNIYFNHILIKEDEIKIINSIKKIDSDIFSKEIFDISQKLEEYKKYLQTDIMVNEITLKIHLDNI